MSKLFFTLFTLVALLLTSTTIATAGNKHKNKGFKQPKIDICHYLPRLDRYFVISVGQPAANAHIRHGDYLVTDEVCNGIDDNCDGEVDEGCAPSEVSCEGIPANYADVCSGHGECVEQDICSCDEGYTGDQCQDVVSEPECFTLSAYDPDVCSGHGECIEQDICSCDEGYTGDQCQDMVLDLECFDILATDPDVCSGHGECVEQDICSCDAGFTGDQCQDMVLDLECYNILASDPDVCSGNGECVGVDTCECYAGHTGEQCQDT